MAWLAPLAGPQPAGRTRSTASFPPLSVVMSRLPLARAVDGAQPAVVLEGGRRRAADKSALGVELHEHPRLAFSAATASVPSYQPHEFPDTNKLPDGGDGRLAELHLAAICGPGSDWSVIGTDSL